jgi:HEAT repeat protein
MLEEQSGRIREIAEKPSPDSARLLIRIYSESEWRSTRLEVIRALGRFSDARSLPFLVDLISKNEDLAEQDLAIRSLARQKSRGARLFLHSFYPDAPESLKPSVCYALGLAQDYASSGLLLSDLKDPKKTSNPLFLKNLILALGELKETRALPEIHKSLSEAKPSADRDLELALLFALGRLERDPLNVSRYESRFLEESILWQVYQSTLSQVQIRSQFKLEDYLQKIFESDRPHPLLPFELRSFDLEDVREGLSIFPKDQYRKRHLLSLRAFSPEVASRMLEELVVSEIEWKSFFESLIETGAGVADSVLAERLLKAAGGESASLELRLDWMDAFLPVVDFAKEGPRFLNLSEERLATRFINLWSERAFSESKSEARKQVRDFLKLGLKEGVFSRLVRACVELSIDVDSIEKEWGERFKNPKNRAALLMYAEEFAYPGGKDAAMALNPEESVALLPRIFGYLESLAKAGKLQVSDSRLEGFLKTAVGKPETGLLGALRVLRAVPFASFKEVLISALGSKDDSIRLNALIAAKAYPASRELSEVLIEFLNSGSEILRGRALDSSLAHTTLIAKRAVIRHLKERILDEAVVDKIYRDFDPEKKGGEEFFREVSDLLNSAPDHPQWEKLVSLRDRLRPKVESASGASSALLSPEVQDLDARLGELIPAFCHLEPTAKLALRAAEQPFMRSQDLQNLPIDKAPSVLEFCKALDLILEKHLGQKHLFPKLDRELHDFQTLWHRIGFGEDYPHADRVLQLLGLKGKITPELFPLHKAKQMCGTFFNGKILQDRFKIFDGLRAWAVILLVFTRKLSIQGVEVGPMLKLPHLSDEKIILMSKRLMQLQDLRNPAAHRQTYPELESVKVVRSEAIELMNLILG